MAGLGREADTGLAEHTYRNNGGCEVLDAKAQMASSKGATLTSPNRWARR